LKVQLSSLEDGIPAHLEDQYEASQLKLNTQDVEFFDPLVIKATVIKQPDILMVKGHIHSQWKEMCGRCLAKTLRPFDRDVELTLPLQPDQQVCDFTDELRDELILSYSVKLLCELGGKCKGLCPHCGANLNVSACDCNVEKSKESPFSILKNLKKDKK